jgi:hypothetical protein
MALERSSIGNGFSPADHLLPSAQARGRRGIGVLEDRILGNHVVLDAALLRPDAAAGSPAEIDRSGPITEFAATHEEVRSH